MIIERKPYFTRIAILTVIWGFLLHFTSAQVGEPPALDKSDPLGLGVTRRDRPKGASTQITCQKGAEFNNAANLAVFTGSVIVKDSQFTLFCEKLTVYLDKGNKSIDHVVAEGNVVIVQVNAADGGGTQESIGRSGVAIFEPATGNLTLTISPSIQQGAKIHIATSETTEMILNREGRLQTNGPSRLTISERATR